MCEAMNRHPGFGRSFRQRQLHMPGCYQHTCGSGCEDSAETCAGPAQQRAVFVAAGNASG